jgi:hypothetical protein
LAKYPPVFRIGRPKGGYLARLPDDGSPPLGGAAAEDLGEMVQVLADPPA